jgi:hypothetical protein
MPILVEASDLYEVRHELRRYVDKALADRDAKIDDLRKRVAVLEQMAIVGPKH